MAYNHAQSDILAPHQYRLHEASFNTLILTPSLARFAIHPGKPLRRPDFHFALPPHLLATPALAAFPGVVPAPRPARPSTPDRLHDRRQTPPTAKCPHQPRSAPGSESPNRPGS